MYEKILSKLMAQRASLVATTGKTSNVSDRSLQDLAKALSAIITTDDVLTTVDLSAAIASIDGNINHYTKTQLQKMKDEEAQLKADAGNKEAAEIARKKAEAEGKPDIKGEVAAAIQAAMEPLMKEISGLKGAKISGDRSEKLNTILKTAPDAFKAPILASFKRMNFETDEDFSAFTTEITTSRDAFLQSAKELGLPFTIPVPNPKIPVDTGETKELGQARKIANDAKKASEEK